MNNQLSTQIFKTGALVKVYMCAIPKNAYRLGVTILLKNELLIVFKNGRIIKRLGPYFLFIEYICATYLIGETFRSLEHILLQFKFGRFDDVFKNIHEHA